MKMNNKGKLNFNFESIDGFALILLVIGFFILMEGNNIGGLIVICLAFLRQFYRR